MEPVLPDTNVWARYFQGRDRTIRETVDGLAAAGRIRLLAPVRFEVLHGIRPKPRFDFVRGSLSSHPAVPLRDPEDWDAAAALGQRLAAAGGKHRVQMTDLLLAVVSARTGASVWSADPDLTERIADHQRLALFDPRDS